MKLKLKDSTETVNIDPKMLTDWGPMDGGTYLLHLEEGEPGTALYVVEGEPNDVVGRLFPD